MSAASLDEVRTDRVSGFARYRDEDFPGCESFHLPADELDTYGALATPSRPVRAMSVCTVRVIGVSAGR